MKNVFTPADILLPKDKNFQDWAVIACDQFSSEPSYWDRVSSRVKSIPSTLHMIVPEAYLEGISMEEASVERNNTMKEYLEKDIFSVEKNAYIYVERSVSGGLVRRGIIGKIDLDAYDFMPGTETPIRASEKTVVDRLPPRIAVRRGAVLELPHILVLMDDAERGVVEPLTEKKSSLEKIYDFELMEGGGRIAGYALRGEEADRVTKAIDALGKRAVQLVIGDGNHSLAAAKEIWRSVKETLPPEKWEGHPQRYALVELCNVYDEGIVFEPIHRIAFSCDPERVLGLLKEKMYDPAGRPLRYIAGGKEGEITLRSESLGALIASVQGVLDVFEKEGSTLDYIHDDSALEELSKKENTFALFLPKMEKSDLFSTVEVSGVFPKKSFSIGHARDKRYYLECRKIK